MHHCTAGARLALSLRHRSSPQGIRKDAMVYAALHGRLSAPPWTLGVRAWAFDNRGMDANHTLHGCWPFPAWAFAVCAMDPG
jgi:hypothetical protein